MYKFDDLDRAILHELERDARISFSELSRRLDTPHTTIRDRVRKMEKGGVIQGYRAIINPEQLGLNIKAIAHITRDQTVSLADITSEPRRLPEITRIQVLTGEVDELITFYARNVEHLKEIIYDEFGAIPGVVKMSTSIVLEEREFCLVGHDEEEDVGVDVELD
ncbi:MAG: Lrp/AsnC family transcriptional regulator [Chloroflexi bacterium]|nr:Lrp/AsnC family transcriptional regulator [Chloroflexota bacterium]